MTRFLTLLCTLLWASAALATEMQVNTPADGFLNLRTGPSLNHHVVMEMPHGSRVTVTAEHGRWVRLRHESGRIGWAAARYLEPVTPEPRLDALWVDAPRHGGLNLRQGPGTGYAVITQMAHGDRVERLGGRDGWLFLRHKDGAVGWAHADYLSAHAPGYPATPPHAGRCGWLCRQVLAPCRDARGPAFRQCVRNHVADVEQRIADAL